MSSVDRAIESFVTETSANKTTEQHDYIVIPNTAVFGPTKLIGTIPSTMRMKILDEDFG